MNDVYSEMVDVKTTGNHFVQDIYFNSDNLS